MAKKIKEKLIRLFDVKHETMTVEEAAKIWGQYEIGPAKLWQQVVGYFLLAIVIGIVIGLTYLILSYPEILKGEM